MAWATETPSLVWIPERRRRSISPGGRLRTESHLAGADGTFNPQLNCQGVNADEFGQLVVDEAATLGGALEVSLLDGFEPTVGQFFQFVTTRGGILTEFDSVNLPALAGEKILRLVYGETLVGLEVIAGLEGDFDGDGDIDGIDFLLWQRHPSIGDLADWQENYGTNSAIAAQLTVPEPLTVPLVVAILLVMTCNRMSAGILS